MMAKKTTKFYVVWKGLKPGVYDTWAIAKRQIDGYPGAQYKSYTSRKEAAEAFAKPLQAQQKIKKQKKTVYYVVWQGHKPGIYTEWQEAKKQIDGFSKPRYKSFGSKQLAQKAFTDDPEVYAGRGFKKTRDMSAEEQLLYGLPNPYALAVDAACNHKGDMEYRGVFVHSGDEIFRAGPFKNGSNNVGEFLGLVHGLAWLKNERSDIPIYSDSRNAMSWVKRKKANTKIDDAKLLALVKRAEDWLKNNAYPNQIIKWQTKFWGEIPADFNRK